MSIQLKRCSYVDLNQNHVLLDGQIGLEQFNGTAPPPRMKIGDGVHKWSELNYATPDPNTYKDTSIDWYSDTSVSCLALNNTTDGTHKLTLDIGSTSQMVSLSAITETSFNSLSIGNESRKQYIRFCQLSGGSGNPLNRNEIQIDYSGTVYAFTTSGMYAHSALLLGTGVNPWNRIYTNNITVLTDPVVDTDGVNKSYADKCGLQSKTISSGNWYYHTPNVPFKPDAGCISFGHCVVGVMAKSGIISFDVLIPEGILRFGTNVIQVSFHSLSPVSGTYDTPSLPVFTTSVRAATDTSHTIKARIEVPTLPSTMSAVPFVVIYSAGAAF